jgi:hypothetical protein
VGAIGDREAGCLVRFVGDKPIGFVEPLERGRLERGFHLTRVVSTEEKFTGLKTYSNISLSAARVTTVETGELGCCGDI